jgi:hypothetical protein
MCACVYDIQVHINIYVRGAEAERRVCACVYDIYVYINIYVRGAEAERRTVTLYCEFLGLGIGRGLRI